MPRHPLQDLKRLVNLRPFWRDALLSGVEGALKSLFAETQADTLRQELSVVERSNLKTGWKSSRSPIVLVNSIARDLSPQSIPGAGRPPTGGRSPESGCLSTGLCCFYTTFRKRKVIEGAGKSPFCNS